MCAPETSYLKQTCCRLRVICCIWRRWWPLLYSPRPRIRETLNGTGLGSHAIMYFGNHASFSGFGLSMHIAKLNSKYHINRRLCCFCVWKRQIVDRNWKVVVVVSQMLRVIITNYGSCWLIYLYDSELLCNFIAVALDLYLGRWRMA